MPGPRRILGCVIPSDKKAGWKHLADMRINLQISLSCPSVDRHSETMKYPGALASCSQPAWDCGAKAGRTPALQAIFRLEKGGEG